MIRLIIALLLLVSVIGEAKSRTIYIRDDFGGRIIDYNKRLKLYNRRKDRIVIDGTCMSACVRFMGVEHACSTVRGYFYFHGVTGLAGKLLYQDSVEDSLRYDLPKAYALEEKYDAFGFHRTSSPEGSEQFLESGVSIVYRQMADDPTMYMKFLKVRADLIIPRCR